MQRQVGRAEEDEYHGFVLIASLNALLPVVYNFSRTFFEMSLTDSLYEMLPEINSLQALFLYSFLAYLLTALIQWCSSAVFEDQIDIHARVKQKIITQRKKRD
jgi:hypothetical protein